MTRMRERCESLLDEGELIELEAEGTCKLGLLSDFGEGCVYLTDRRLLWIRRDISLIGPLLFWIPDVVDILRSDIEKLRKASDFTRAWLEITVDGKDYKLRIGKGFSPMLRENPETTQTWFDRLTHEKA